MSKEPLQKIFQGHTNGHQVQEKMHNTSNHQENAYRNHNEVSLHIFSVTRIKKTDKWAGGSDGKESACSAEDPSLIPGLGRSPGEGHGNPLQYSCLENPMNRGASLA